MLDLLRIAIEVGAAGVLFWIVSRYFAMKKYAELQADMCERISDALDKIRIDEGVPVVAVERYLHYIKYPSHSFDPADIIRQEKLNQTTSIGAAKE